MIISAGKCCHLGVPSEYNRYNLYTGASNRDLGTFLTMTNPHTNINKITIAVFYSATFNLAEQFRIIFEHEGMTARHAIMFFHPYLKFRNFTLHIDNNKGIVRSIK